MEAIILIGIQATGKSTFYRERFFRTHIRISLDQLRTRHREQRFLSTCLETNQKFVVDNTNPTPENRHRYIIPAQQAKFAVIGYYFESKIEAALGRNAQRTGDEVIPEAGVLAIYSRLRLPTFDEGFDELYYVRISDEGRFHIERWTDEI